MQTYREHIINYELPGCKLRNWKLNGANLFVVDQEFEVPRLFLKYRKPSDKSYSEKSLKLHAQNFICQGILSQQDCKHLQLSNQV